jgi:hypothetical protein
MFEVGQLVRYIGPLGDGGIGIVLETNSFRTRVKWWGCFEGRITRPGNGWLVPLDLEKFQETRADIERWDHERFICETRKSLMEL